MTTDRLIAFAAAVTFLWFLIPHLGIIDISTEHGVPGELTLEWDASPGALSYAVSFDHGPQFWHDEPIITLPPHVNHVRLWACNSEGKCSEPTEFDVVRP